MLKYIFKYLHKASSFRATLKFVDFVLFLFGRLVLIRSDSSITLITRRAHVKVLVSVSMGTVIGWYYGAFSGLAFCWKKFLRRRGQRPFTIVFKNNRLLFLLFFLLFFILGVQQGFRTGQKWFRGWRRSPCSKKRVLSKH